MLCATCPEQTLRSLHRDNSPLTRSHTAHLQDSFFGLLAFTASSIFNETSFVSLICSQQSRWIESDRDKRFLSVQKSTLTLSLTHKTINLMKLQFLCNGNLDKHTHTHNMQGFVTRADCFINNDDATTSYFIAN
jgi:hypothetical protein